MIKTSSRQKCCSSRRPTITYTQRVGRQSEPIYHLGNCCCVDRLYGESHNELAYFIKDALVATTMSAYSLGPRIYGIFANGRIEQLVDARILSYDEILETSVLDALAVQTAHFHALDLPLKREPRWLFDTIDKYVTSIKYVLCIYIFAESLSIFVCLGTLAV